MQTFLHPIDHNRYFVLDVMRVLAKRLTPETGMTCSM
jgi:hypothetical protein